MRDPIVFSHITPVANVYEFKIQSNGTVLGLNKQDPKEGRKNMENVNTIVNTEEMVQANDLLDRVEPLTDEELEAILAASEFSQDADDVAPAIETSEPTYH